MGDTTGDNAQDINDRERRKRRIEEHKKLLPSYRSYKLEVRPKNKEHWTLITAYNYEGLKTGKIIVYPGVKIKHIENNSTTSDLMKLSEQERKTVRVISGFRTQKEQDKLFKEDPERAAEVSFHTTDIAIDIMIEGYSSRKLAKAVYKTGVFNRVSSYPTGTSVHVDYNTTRRQGLFHNWYPLGGR